MTDKVKTRLQVELKRRGVHKYLKTVQQVSDEDTDIEVMYEIKEILMTEMEYILEKLLLKERQRSPYISQDSKDN